ncbi:hypothetical protein BXZ70DRAFT_1011537 [Cristinia sonorae]|uniref:Uncharacterized protein n=1 Tax=Cristinia sonorae TaxID=1940300 RepID=A0A8K0XLA4_9AGAR|nr:hypothetical protein BXZ70DRAFT_1011537 [Cristinia sonorae]
MPSSYRVMVVLVLVVGFLSVLASSAPLDGIIADPIQPMKSSPYCQQPVLCTWNTTGASKLSSSSESSATMDGAPMATIAIGTIIASCASVLATLL